MVTHDKCGESDGPFATYEEAKAHYEYLCSDGDPDSAQYYFIEEVRDGNPVLYKAASKHKAPNNKEEQE